MLKKRVLVVQAKLVRKIDDKRGGITQAEFIDLLIDSQLEQGSGAPDEQKYATKEELRLFEEDLKQFLKNFLTFFISYGLRSDNMTIKATERLHREYQAQLESCKQQVTAPEVGYGRMSSQPAQTNPTTTEEEKKALISIEKQETTEYELAAELEILPPLDMHRITRAMIYLEGLPEVKTVELVPLADKPSVIVLLHQPIHLIERLKTLPEVSQVEEVTEGKMIRIQMKLSGNSVLDEVKEKLDSRASGNPQPPP